MSLRRRVLPSFLAIAAVGSTTDAGGAERDVDHTARQPHTRRRTVALTVNPLGAVIRRYGGNVEWSPAPHHALVGTAYVQSVPMELVKPFARGIEITDGAAPPALGGEIGYRLYTGRSGPVGLFVGGSFVAMPVAYPRLTYDRSVELAGVYGYGGAVDVGAQAITSFGLTIGGGLGASVVSYDMPDDPRRLPITLPNLLPRLLLATGFAF